MRRKIPSFSRRPGAGDQGQGKTVNGQGGQGGGARIVNGVGWLDAYTHLRIVTTPKQGRDDTSGGQTDEDDTSGGQAVPGAGYQGQGREGGARIVNGVGWLDAYTHPRIVTTPEQGRDDTSGGQADKDDTSYGQAVPGAGDQGQGREGGARIVNGVG